MNPYIAIVLFPVPLTVADRFIAINQQAARRYQQLGADGNEILQLADGAPKYGCLGLAGAIKIREDETLFMVVDRFRDKHHFLAIDDLASHDAACVALFDELTEIIDISRSVRLELENAALTPPASHAPENAPPPSCTGSPPAAPG